ncbi:MAG: sensor histidine kinase [Crocinitomicaceae bacterium]
MNKDSIQKPKKTFWAMNISGWALMSIINIVFQTEYFTTNFDAFYYSFVITSFGFFMSILMRFVILRFKLIELKFILVIPILVLITVVASILCTLAFSGIISLFFDDQSSSLSGMVRNVFNFNLVFLIWTLIYTSFLFFERQKYLAEQKLHLSLQLKEAELNNLRKQLSPHFLFNAINNIRSLILIDPEKSREALLNVSDLLRYALNYQKRESVTVEEEMEIVQGYINLNKIHLGKNVNFEIDIVPELNDLGIPPMSIQLLVENAIKHGEIIAGSVVTVQVKQLNNYRIIQVSNPGKLDHSNSDGIGIKNLNERLQSMYQTRAEFLIFEEQGIVNAQIKIS